jgi:hypothetical protein
MWGNRREVGKGCSYGQWEVFASAGSYAHVLSEYWCSFLRRHQDETNTEGAAVGNLGIAVRGLYILYPIRIDAEH